MTKTIECAIIISVIFMEKYYIYKFENKKNGKVYIGQSINPEKRKLEHLYGRKTRQDTYFDRVLKKQGIENFNFEIIDCANSTKEIDELEKKYIELYNAIKPNGYNILKGGREQRGAWNSKSIDEYDLNGNYMATYESASYYSNFVNTEYNTRQIRRSCTKKTKYKERMFRFKGEEKPEPYKKPKPNHTREIYQRDLNGNLIAKFESIEKASEITHTSRTSIIGCARGNYKTAGDYIWTYEETYNNDLEFNAKSIIKTLLYQCDENKKILKKYCNSREAERENGFKYNSYKNILKYLDTNKMYNGYYWYRVKYYEDNIVPSLNEN